jgi:hypothetical protein
VPKDFSKDTRAFHLTSFSRIQHFFTSTYERHETLVSSGIFFLGFFFDIFTLGKIDDFQNIIQQLLYLIFTGLLLVFEFSQNRLSSDLLKKLGIIKKFHNLIIHFLFGSLLSIYTIFYFNSASLFSSFIFLSLIAGLTLANEFQFFQEKGLLFRGILFNICLLSFLLICYPIVFGSIGPYSFWMSLLTSFCCTLFINKFLKQFTEKEILKTQFFIPSILTKIVFILFYFTSIIPPVPLTLKKIGVYYSINKSNGKYSGEYLEEWPYFWHRGSQIFRAREGDPLVVILSIYSPTAFQDQITLNWNCKSENGLIQTKDVMPIFIKGGRDEGFRGYALKNHYPFGECKISVQTMDHRELGSLSVKIVQDTARDHREFLIEHF